MRRAWSRHSEDPGVLSKVRGLHMYLCFGCVSECFRKRYRSGILCDGNMGTWCGYASPDPSWLCPEVFGMDPPVS